VSEQVNEDEFDLASMVEQAHALASRLDEIDVEAQQLHEAERVNTVMLNCAAIAQRTRRAATMRSALERHATTPDGPVGAAVWRQALDNATYVLDNGPQQFMMREMLRDAEAERGAKRGGGCLATVATMALLAIVGAIIAGCGSSLSESSTCEEFMSASADEQRSITMQLAEQYEKPAFATPLGLPAVPYYCAKHGDETLGHYFGEVAQ
jgi:hypothetical protein